MTSAQIAALAEDIDFAIDVTEPREVRLQRFKDAIIAALAAPPPDAPPVVTMDVLNGVTVAGARAFWALKDLEARHERLRVAIMVAVSVPELGRPNPTWAETRKLLTDAFNADGSAAPPPAAGSSIVCPACGDTVQQVSSATLSLALFQHWNWACRKRPDAGLVALVRNQIADYVLSCREDDHDRPMVQVFDVLARHIRQGTADTFPLPAPPQETP